MLHKVSRVVLFVFVFRARTRVPYGLHADGNFFLPFDHCHSKSFEPVLNVQDSNSFESLVNDSNESDSNLTIPCPGSWLQQHLTVRIQSLLGDSIQRGTRQSIYVYHELLYTYAWIIRLVVNPLHGGPILDKVNDELHRHPVQAVQYFHSTIDHIGFMVCDIPFLTEGFDQRMSLTEVVSGKARE